MTDIEGKDTPPALVERDVTEGLSELFAPREGFRVAERFAHVEPMSNGTHTSVVWEYSAVHTGDFQGIRPTGQEIVVSGVTIVDTSGGEPAFHRYIDWVGVLAQLGVSTTGRPALENAFG